MTARKIVIQDCGECPSSDHKGEFGAISRIPVCRKADCELPWTTSANRAGFVSAKREPGIPDWCPLPKDTGGAQEPTPVQLSDEQTANAVLLAYMLTSTDRFGILMPSCQFAPQKLQDVAPGIVDGFELTEAGKALKQRVVQMMHDARVKGGA